MKSFIRNTMIYLMGLGLCTGAAALVPSAAHAALDAYATIVGETQGVIGGDVDLSPHEGKILIKAFGSSVSADYDAETGIPRDGKQHRPVRLLKNVDPASTKLLAALKNNELLTSVTLEFYRPNQVGAEQLFVTVVLENAHVVSILPSQSSQDDDLTIPFRETVSLTYESMTVTWELTDDSTQINW